MCRQPGHDSASGGRPRAAIVADLRARLGVLPVSLNVGQPISHRLDHMLSGVRAEIALKLFGEDLDGLRRTAEALTTAFETIPGIADLSIEKQVRIPQLEVRVDSGRAALYGIAPGAVVEAVSRLANGRVVSTLVDGLRRYDVTLRLPESGRSKPARSMSVTVTSSASPGGRVRAPNSSKARVISASVTRSVMPEVVRFCASVKRSGST